jgi:ABC-type glycerol-3-phosphate transport system substrate-binding protein
MKAKKNLLVLAGGILLGGMALSSLGGCSGNGSGSIAGSQSGASASSADFSGLTDDLDFDDNGKPLFDNVELSVWSIVGSPDDVIYKKLIDAFNNEYLGQIKLNVTYVGNYDYYNTLDTTWQNDFASAPDVCFMHNEKTTEYAYKGYLYPLTEAFLAKTQCSLDFTQAFPNIDRVTKFNGVRYAVPVDGHGFLTQFRQDIIKKNGLGFDNNTRYIPESYAEYLTLLQGLRAKADAGTLSIRNINKGQNHAWKYATKASFYPSFTQSTDPDGLSSLYANGGALCSEDHKIVTFQNNPGFKSYLTDQVNRWNSKLIGESGTNTELFGEGNIAMFSEGPWWVAQTYDPNWNNAELTTANASLGVSQDDVDNYPKPYTASHPKGWWTIPANASLGTASQWYGNGHAISLTKHLTSWTKAAAALEFAKWYTQGKNADTGIYNLATWTTGGHLPAWQNVYQSTDYQNIRAKNMTLQALGDPSDIIAMEDIPYETTVFNGLASSCSQVISALKSDSGCTETAALQILSDTAASTQASIDLLYEG